MMRCEHCIDAVVPASKQVAWKRARKDSTWVLSQPLCDEHVDNYLITLSDADNIELLRL